MLRLLSIAALACAAIVAAAPNSPASAAALMINNVGPRIGAVNNVAGGARFVPNTSMIAVHASQQGPKQRRWICGPLLNWDGTPHCHWVEH